ncbi:MAG: hypothetical protein LUH00_03115 [Lachnospiraceae bacterium]|nr:hypothetical protein [Lachnospiraceae bacterium]
MKSVLQKIPLKLLIKQPVMFDANIFMVGIENRPSDSKCSFKNMYTVYLKPLFECFQQIIIHEMIYNELDEDAKRLVDSYKEKNVMIVGEGDLYGKDPQYTTIFNEIANHERVMYTRGNSKDRGEVYSLAYAAYNKINYFSSKEVMVDLIAEDLDALKDVEIVTFDVILLLAYIYYATKEDTSNKKALKSIYKRYCEDVIKRHKLPATLKEYVVASIDYIEN